MRDINMNSVRAIDRAIDVLQAFSIKKPVLTIEEISKITQIPKNTVYRILYTLERRGFIQFDQSALTYKPGLRLMGFAFLASSVITILQEAEPFLIDLHNKTKQTVLMAIKDGDQILYVYKREIEHYEGLKFSSLVGQRRSFLYGVLGPVLLAYLPDQDIERILNNPIRQRTPYTVTDKNVIRKRLQKIKEERIFIESNETGLGITGVGAPVFDVNGETAAAIGVAGPSVQMDDQLEKVKLLVLETSKHISEKMGYQSEKT
jgi:DNA-binding IclR family transcriptional regulator